MTFSIEDVFFIKVKVALKNDVISSKRLYNISTFLDVKFLQFNTRLSFPDKNSNDKREHVDSTPVDKNINLLTTNGVRCYPKFQL